MLAIFKLAIALLNWTRGGKMHKARSENAGNNKILGKKDMSPLYLNSFVSGQQLEWLLLSLIQVGLILLQELSILWAAT